MSTVATTSNNGGASSSSSGWKHYLPALDLTVTAASSRAAQDLERAIVLSLQHQSGATQAFNDAFSLRDDGTRIINNTTSNNTSFSKKPSNSSFSSQQQAASPVLVGECLCPVARGMYDSSYNTAAYATSWRDLLAFGSTVQAGGDDDSLTAVKRPKIVIPVALEPWEANFLEAAIQFGRFRIDAAMALCVRNLATCWNDIFSARMMLAVAIFSSNMETMSETFSRITRKYNAKADSEINAMMTDSLPRMVTRLHIVRPYVAAFSAFALHESGILDGAERTARKALEETEKVNTLYGFPLKEAPDPTYHVGALAAFAPSTKEYSNVAAVHALCHVYDMRGLPKEGIAFLVGPNAIRPEVWKAGDHLATHICWHLALYFLDIGDLKSMFAVYDEYLATVDAVNPLRLADATSLLWRLQLLSDVDIARLDVGLKLKVFEPFATERFDELNRGRDWRHQQFKALQPKWEAHPDERIALIPFIAMHKRYNRKGFGHSDPNFPSDIYTVAKEGLENLKRGYDPVGATFVETATQQQPTTKNSGSTTTNTENEATTAPSSTASSSGVTGTSGGGVTATEDGEDGQPPMTAEAPSVVVDNPDMICVPAFGLNQDRSINAARNLFCHFSETTTSLLLHGSRAPFILVLNGLYRFFLPHASTDPWTGGNPLCDMWARQYITSVKPVHTTIHDSSAPPSVDLTEALKLERPVNRMLNEYAAPMGGSRVQRDLVILTWLCHSLGFAAILKKRGPISGTVKPPPPGSPPEQGPDATKYIAAQADQIMRTFLNSHMLPMIARMGDMYADNARVNMLAEFAVELQ